MQMEGYGENCHPSPLKTFGHSGKTVRMPNICETKSNADKHMQKAPDTQWSALNYYVSPRNPNLLKIVYEEQNVELWLKNSLHKC